MTLEEIKSKLPHDIKNNNTILILDTKNTDEDKAMPLVNVDNNTNIMQYDNASKAISVVVPRMIDGHDMTDCNAGSVHWRILDYKTGNTNSGVIALGNNLSNSNTTPHFQKIDSTNPNNAYTKKIFDFMENTQHDYGRIHIVDELPTDNHEYSMYVLDKKDGTYEWYVPSSSYPKCVGVWNDNTTDYGVYMTDYINAVDGKVEVVDVLPSLDINQNTIYLHKEFGEYRCYIYVPDNTPGYESGWINVGMIIDNPYCKINELTKAVCDWDIDFYKNKQKNTLYISIETYMVPSEIAGKYEPSTRFEFYVYDDEPFVNFKEMRKADLAISNVKDSRIDYEANEWSTLRVLAACNDDFINSLPENVRHIITISDVPAEGDPETLYYLVKYNENPVIYSYIDGNDSASLFKTIYGANTDKTYLDDVCNFIRASTFDISDIYVVDNLPNDNVENGVYIVDNKDGTCEWYITVGPARRETIGAATQDSINVRAYIFANVTGLKVVDALPTDKVDNSWLYLLNYNNVNNEYGCYIYIPDNTPGYESGWIKIGSIINTPYCEIRELNELCCYDRPKGYDTNTNPNTLYVIYDGKNSKPEFNVYYDGSKSLIKLKDWFTTQYGIEMLRYGESYALTPCNAIKRDLTSRLPEGMKHITCCWELPTEGETDTLYFKTKDEVCYSFADGTWKKEDPRKDDILHTEIRFKDNVTQFAGAMTFSIRFERNIVDENNMVKNEYRFVTGLNRSISIVSGLDASASMEQEYHEVFQNIQTQFNQIESSVTEHVEQMDTVIAEKLNDVKDEFVDAVVDELEEYRFATKNEITALFDFNPAYDYDPNAPTLTPNDKYYVYTQIDDKVTSVSDNPVSGKAVNEALKTTTEEALEKIEAKGYTTKADVEKIIENLGAASDVKILDFEIVDALPTDSINQSTLYITRNDDGSISYNRYKDCAWETIGGSKVDPTNFATDDEIGAVLGAELDGYTPGDYYVYTEDLSNYYTKTEVDDKMANVTASIDVDDQLSTTSENPVQNKVITEALKNIEVTQPIMFSQYEDLTNELLASEADAFKADQMILITDRDLPNLWISYVSNTFKYYYYATEVEFLDEIKTNGFLQIGYYQLHTLEPLNENSSSVEIDDQLSTTSENPVQNKVITEALKNKIDQIDKALKLYGTNVNGKQTAWDLRYTNNTPNTIAGRDSNGNIQVATAVNDSDATSKKYVDDKFNGSNKAVSFVDYSSMITSLNALDKTSYNVGQNVMIVTLEVPDLWVSEITEDSVAYTYVSDDDFINELKTNGYVQVGYYKLSALETQKVDLSEYAKYEDLNNKLTLCAWGSDKPYDVPLYIRDSRGLNVANAPDGSGKKVLGVRFATEVQVKGQNETMPFSTNQISLAVRAGLTSPKVTWTDDEKALARENLGITSAGGTKLYKHTFSEFVNEQNKFFIITNKPNGVIYNVDNYGECVLKVYIYDFDIITAWHEEYENAGWGEVIIKTYGFELAYDDRYSAGYFKTIGGVNVREILGEQSQSAIVTEL